MNRLDYLLQKISLIIFLIASSLSILYALSFSSDVSRLSLDPSTMRYYERYDSRIGTHIVETVNHITRVYEEFMKTNDTIFKLSVLSLAGVGLLFLIGCYRRKRYTLIQNILTKIIPILCLGISIYSFLRVMNLKSIYLQIDFAYYKEFVTVIDNENYNIFSDSNVIIKSLTYFNLSYIAYCCLFISSILVLAITTIKWLKFVPLKKGGIKNEY